MMPRQPRSGKRVLGLFPCLLLAGACDIGRPSERTISQILEASSKFRAPYIAYVPKQIVLIPRVVAGETDEDADRINGMMSSTYNMPSLDAAAIARIDASVALMQAAGFVTVSDASNTVTLSQPPLHPGVREEDGHISVYAADRLRSYEMYGHVITIQKRPVSGEAAKDWHDDEDGPEDDSYYSGFNGIRTTPGWRVEVAHRALVRIEEIVDETSINDQVAHDELLVKFTYRWEPTASGEVFVPGTDASRKLPGYFRYLSALGGGALRTQEVRGHLVLRKTPQGWKPVRLAEGWKDMGGPNAKL